MNPSVSVIMPCFNSERYLAVAVESVIRQSFTSWELLICDDSSTDGSVNLIQEYASQDKRIVVVENFFGKGAAGARKSCEAKARGRYIAFLDSDDSWLPQKLELQIRALSQNKAAFVYSDYQVMSEEGLLGCVYRTPACITRKSLYITNLLPCLTVMYDRKTIQRVEYPLIEKRNDYALWLSIFCQNESVQATRTPEVLARYRVNSYGLSANKVDAIKYAYICLRRYADLGVVKSILLVSVHSIFAVIKKSSPSLYSRVVRVL